MPKVEKFLLENGRTTFRRQEFTHKPTRTLIKPQRCPRPVCCRQLDWRCPPRCWKLLWEPLGTLADIGLLAPSGVDVADAENNVSIVFEDFLRIVALVLEEEAAANPDLSQGELAGDSAGYWDASQFQTNDDDADDLDPSMMYREDA